MSFESIERYFKSNIFKPLFMVVGDKSYTNYRKMLYEAKDAEIICLSSFCKEPDKKPNLDKLSETLRMADVYCESNKLVVLGLGEYLALEGKEKAHQVLMELINFNLGSAHAVFLLRGVNNIVKDIVSNDPRYNGRQIEFDCDTDTELIFRFASKELAYYDDDGIQAALKCAENGEKNIISTNTSLRFEDSLVEISILRDPYEAVRRRVASFNIAKEKGDEDNWEQLLCELQEYNTLDFVFSKRGFDGDLTMYYQRANGCDFEKWLYYIYLLSVEKNISNKYLRFILENSSSFEDYNSKVLNAITEIPHTSVNYKEYYQDRKKLIEKFPESEMAAFIVKNRENMKESIFRLTDNTLVEREEIIACISKQGVPDNLNELYQDLELYLRNYSFSGDALNERLTLYFNEYKKNKLLNKIDSSFLELVDELAISREYNRLRTRDEIVSSIDKSDTFLCWVDALGAEYLSYLTEQAKAKGLAVSVKIGRANLPTITSTNRQFYDEWPEGQKRKIEELDEIKHKEKGGYKYGSNNMYPIHLAKELEILNSVIDDAATNLSLRKYEKYVIASDHGASRLAVIRKKEEKYDTDTRGEHSGRCCKSFQDYDLPFSTEENGYIVLADYGRFKGSRAANVEVHGGASLEEVVVPIITLSLKDNSIVVNMVEDYVKADHRNGISVTIYVNKRINSALYLELLGNKYCGQKIDDNHYSVEIPEIKRAGKYSVGVFLDDNLLSQIEITAVGQSASMDTEFDDLF